MKCLVLINVHFHQVIVYPYLSDLNTVIILVVIPILFLTYIAILVPGFYKQCMKLILSSYYCRAVVNKTSFGWVYITWNG